MSHTGHLNDRKCLHPTSSVLISSWLCSILEAVILSNVYHYFTHYKNDHIFLKLLVGFTTIAEIVAAVGGYAHLYMARLFSYFLRPV